MSVLHHRRAHALPRHGRWHGAALAALPLASAAGMAIDPRLGLCLGFLLVFAAMLTGLSYWADRFAQGRWTSRARTLLVTAGAEDYRGTQALDVRVDGRPIVPRAVYVNTAERPGLDRTGMYAVLLDSDRGLVEVDLFEQPEPAWELGESLGRALGIDAIRSEAGPSHGGDSTFDGLLTWTGMSAPVLAFLPFLLVAPGGEWVPSMALLLFLAMSLGLDLRARTTRSSAAEQQFRERLRPARVRLETPAPEVSELARTSPQGKRSIQRG